jgi:hypothetical protein
VNRGRVPVVGVVLLSIGTAGIVAAAPTLGHSFNEVVSECCAVVSLTVCLLAVVGPDRVRAWFRLGFAGVCVRFGSGAASAVPGVWMRVAAWLMPGSVGQEWLAEAHSVMFEAAPGVRRSIERSYLLAAWHVLVVAWAAALTGRLRAARAARLPGGRGR